MQITSRLTVAVHTLLVISYFQDQYKVTSDFIAKSVQVNPVVIRRILLKLKETGLVEVARGSGGASLNKELSDVTLLDLYRAVDCVGTSMFHFHENPNQKCPVGSRIHEVLDGRLKTAQDAFEQSLGETTLADLAARLRP